MRNVAGGRVALSLSGCGLNWAVNREFEKGQSTTEFEACSCRTPAWTPINISDPSTREHREFARERRGPKPNQRHFGNTTGQTASNCRMVRKSQKSKNVKDMRGRTPSDAVNRNEAGIWESERLAPLSQRYSNFSMRSPTRSAPSIATDSSVYGPACVFSPTPMTLKRGSRVKSRGTRRSPRRERHCKKWKVGRLDRCT